MENKIEFLVEAYSKDLNKPYVYMLFCFMNLCTESDPTSLLSTTVVVNGRDFDLEKVAAVYIPDKDHFCIKPTIEENIPYIIEGLMKEHPEFTPKPMLVDNTGFVGIEDAQENDPRLKIVLCTIPPVNKDRRDLLIDFVDAFYQKCKIQMEELKVKYSSRLVKDYTHVLSAEDMDNAKDKFNENYQLYTQYRDKLKEDKIKEIEDAYQRYLENQEGKDLGSSNDKGQEATHKNIATSMNMFAEDDE
jgi:ribosome recycling factor